VNSPRHCATHDWMAMARIDGAPWPASYPRDVTAYCPTHGWTHFTHDVAGPSGTATPPLCTSSPMVVSPVRSPSPPGARGGRVASPTPPGIERQGTIAARRGAPPLDINNVPSGNAAPLHPPPPPPTWFPARRNATAAANRHPGLISTGHRHLPNGIGSFPNWNGLDDGYLSSDEGEQ
jgi:hypothetical protein